MNAGITTNTTNRSSNFELLRIIMMLSIVLSHYCCLSGLPELLDLQNITFNTILIQFFTCGKVGVNVFLLISGYFMINKSFKFIKVIKLILEVLFYNCFVFILLKCVGYSYSFNEIIKYVCPIIFELPESFIGAYLLVYIISPLLNNGVKSLSKRQYQIVLFTLIIYFSVLQTFFFIQTWNYFGWAVTLYLLGGYIKLYENLFPTKKRIYIISIFINLLIIWSSILLIDYFGCGKYFAFSNYLYMFTNANKFFVLLLSVSIFLLFKNIKIPQNNFINTVAQSAFGVLLLHSNNPLMRKWLWQDCLKTPQFFNSSYFIIHMLSSVLTIYIVCTVIDYIRIKFIEKPFFNLLEKLYLRRSQI